MLRSALVTKSYVEVASESNSVFNQEVLRLILPAWPAVKGIRIGVTFMSTRLDHGAVEAMGAMACASVDGK